MRIRLNNVALKNVHLKLIPLRHSDLPKRMTRLRQFFVKNAVLMDLTFHVPDCITPRPRQETNRPYDKIRVVRRDARVKNAAELSILSFAVFSTVTSEAGAGH